MGTGKSSGLNGIQVRMKLLSRTWWSLAAAAALAFVFLSCSGGSSSPSSPGGGTVYAALGASDALGIGELAVKSTPMPRTSCRRGSSAGRHSSSADRMAAR